MKRLVIATHNRKKAGEMLAILSARFPQIVLRTLADYPGAPEPEETGSTYAENAAIKSRSAAEHTGEWSLADDAGLEIDALNGAPGVFSKRFGGEDLPFPEKMRRILNLLNSVDQAGRGARFRCFVAISSPADPSAARLFEGVCEGKISSAPSGGGGFGYDPIFLPNACPGRTMADLTSEEKHRISHRGKVLRLAGDFIESCVSS